MKVKNTLEIDLVHTTLKDKLINFTQGQHRYVGSWEAIQFVKKTFPSWQYNGAAPFQDIMLWCEEHLHNEWIWNYETIYFKHEKYRTVFILRWS